MNDHNTKTISSIVSFQAGQFQPAVTDSAAIQQQQQYYQWYQQNQQQYPGYTYPYNYYYPMGPVSTEIMFLCSTCYIPRHVFHRILLAVQDGNSSIVALSTDSELYVTKLTIFERFNLNFQYGAAYPPSQYGVPAGPYPGPPTPNGQVYNNFHMKAVILKLYTYF